MHLSLPSKYFPWSLVFEGSFDWQDRTNVRSTNVH